MSDGCRDDDSDQELLRLASMAVQLDPVPVDALVAAQASFAWRAIDEELATLVYDSEIACYQLVSVRSSAGARQLAFEAAGLDIEVEVDLAAEPQLMGQLVPPVRADIAIRGPEASVVVKADGFGRFWSNGLVGGPMSMRVTRIGGDHESASTPWITIRSATTR